MSVECAETRVSLPSGGSHFVEAVVGVVAVSPGAHGGLPGCLGPARERDQTWVHPASGRWNPGFTSHDAVTAAPPAPLAADKTPSAAAVTATLTARLRPAGSSPAHRKNAKLQLPLRPLLVPGRR